jgi:hypothetical protein
MTVPDRSIRPLHKDDADMCDQTIASLPYHFGQEDGRQECAHAVRSQPGLVAVLNGTVVGFLTVQRHFDHAAEITWMAVHARHRHHGPSAIPASLASVWSRTRYETASMGLYREKKNQAHGRLVRL